MKSVLIDILPLKEGKTPADAFAYFAKVQPAMEKAGILRVDSKLEVKKIMRGQINAAIVNLFEVEDPAAAMGAMSQDPEYTKHVPERDEIFDLENATIIATQRVD